jgi:hypothetical protein
VNGGCSAVFAYISFTKVATFDETKAVAHGAAEPYERVAAVPVPIKGLGGFK